MILIINILSVFHIVFRSNTAMDKSLVGRAKLLVSKNYRSFLAMAQKLLPKNSCVGIFQGI